MFAVPASAHGLPGGADCFRDGFFDREVIDQMLACVVEFAAKFGRDVKRCLLIRCIRRAFLRRRNWCWLRSWLDSCIDWSGLAAGGQEGDKLADVLEADIRVLRQ